MNGEAGKGDKLRPGANLKAFWGNYDTIFKKEKDMTYDIKTAKKGDVFWESQYGYDIKCTALEDVVYKEGSQYSGGGAYTLSVVNEIGGKTELFEAAQCGAYGLRLYKTPQYTLQ